MGNDRFSLKGHTALVTGAAGKRGIGRAIALALAEAGADIVICDLNVRGKDFDLESTASEIRSNGVRALSVKADISSKADINNMVELAMKEYGRIDVLVNNAAVAGIFPFFSDNDDLWNRILDINLKGCYLCSRAVSRIMIKQKKGSIVNIASGAGLQWFPDSSVYGISKAGVIQFTRWLAHELGSSGVRVNAIAPTPVNTDLDSHRIDLKSAADNMVASSEKGLNITDRIPLGRIAEPEDIADIALFLACDASRYVTGQVIIADGGLMLSGI